MDDEIITLSLRGVQIITRRSRFLGFPDSLLAKCFCSQSQLQTLPQKDGTYFFDRDPQIFKDFIMPLYDYGFWHCPKPIPPVLLLELEYWGLYLQCTPEPGTHLQNSVEVMAHRFLQALLENKKTSKALFWLHQTSEPFHGWDNLIKVANLCYHYQDLVRTFAVVYYGIYILIEWSTPVTTELSRIDASFNRGGVYAPGQDTKNEVVYAGYRSVFTWNSTKYCFEQVLENKQQNTNLTLPNGLSITVNIQAFHIDIQCLETPPSSQMPEYAYVLCAFLCTEQGYRHLPDVRIPNHKLIHEVEEEVISVATFGDCGKTEVGIPFPQPQVFANFCGFLDRTLASKLVIRVWPAPQLHSFITPLKYAEAVHDQTRNFSKSQLCSVSWKRLYCGRE